ncbi:MAG TPA: phospholipid carrier-dependent glycosyltransferase [Ornithinimicrobium sp.]|nr:phospholipid carrier-dependent glycosyltransferase [Ornithinimicrobium sp.]HKJ12895.1 phospholipid carrier-dependent glycosyltransferase [Ornithinimicrobium sp.]
MTSLTAPPPRAASGREGASSLRERLLGASPSPTQARWAWLGVLLATVAGGALRFFRLGHPHQLVFDETYYVKQGWSLIRFGYERDIREGLEKPDELFTAGDADVFGTTPDLVVHPPVGKWMLGVGEALVGVDSSFGWRLAAAVVGTLSILLLGRIVWHLWHNALLATAGATLLAVDGHHFVHSRTGLLDVFLMFWVLVAFWCLVRDREDGRRRLADRVSALTSTESASPFAWGPRLGMRWWRLAAGVSLGLAVGTKWSGLFFLAVFGLMTVWWDVGARRAAGARRWFSAGVVRDGIPAFLLTVPVAAVTYLGTWGGWLLTDGGYKRQWAADHPAAGAARLVPDALRSLWSYHREIWSFHVDLQNEHAWSSNPWSWTVQGRPTLFFSEWPERGQDGCEAAECVSYIASLGNLFVWWGATAGLLVVLFLWVFGRDWRAGAALSGIAAGWLPWFLYQSRTIYSFYAVAFVPWLVLVVVACMALVLGGERASPRRRRIGAVIVVGYTTAAVALFVWFYPVYTAQVIPREEWEMRLWFDFWT